MSKFARKLYIVGKKIGEQSKSYSNPTKQLYALNMKANLFKQAMSLGYVKPAYELYELFRDGNGVEQNNDLALTMFGIALKLKDKRCDPEVILSDRLIVKINLITKFIREANEKKFNQLDIDFQVKFFNSISLSSSEKIGDCFNLPYMEDSECKNDVGILLVGSDCVESLFCTIF